VLTEFLIALQFLTIIRLKETLPFDDSALGRSAIFFPLVGLLIGSITWGLDRGLRSFCPIGLRNILVVAALAILSRGLHLDGLADSADGLLGSSERQRSLAIMKDSVIGTFGALALIGVLLLKLRALDLLFGEARASALLVGPMLSRWASVAMAYYSHPARTEGLGATFITGVSIREYGWASGFSLLVIIILTGGSGLALVALISGFTFVATRYCSHRLGGGTGDTLGAIGELVETTTFCFFVLAVP
jgi:adenosylcobinamide-GDP ribazoletransferase